MPSKTFAKPLFAVILVMVFSVTVSLAQAQKKILKGNVISANEPLPGATISLVNVSDKQLVNTISNGKGDFELSYALSGTYTLKISHTGFTVYVSQPFVLDNKNFGTIKLEASSNNVEEVEIEIKKDLIEMDGGSIIYNVSKSLDAQGTSAFEALKRAPGVFIDNNDAISLNGKPGAMVLLDGKQTYLSGKEISDLLKSMPSSGIKSIEIINSPSAKYDASGAAGIINIKTSKSQLKGFNGSATVGLAYGVFVRQNQDMSFSYRNDKLNFYGGYNHFIGNYSYLYGSDRIQNNKTYDSFTDDTDKRKKMGTRLGADYNINSKNTIGILVNGNFLFGGGITDTKTEIRNPLLASLNSGQVLDANNDYYYQQTNRYNINLNYKYEDTLGTSFNVDGDYGFYEKGNKNLQSNIYRDNQPVILNQNLYRILNETNIDLKAIKFDYATNLWKGKLETGAKYSDISTGNDSEFYHVLNSRDSLDTRKSNNFGFSERITSGYINYKRSFGKWVLQGGLRLENSASAGALTFKIDQKDSVENINRNYTNLFPSLSISVKPAINHGFSLSYSRRIDRPAYQDLNPFVYLLDELSFWQGNPFLQPQLTHRAALQYVYKNSTIIGLTYAYTDNYSAKITDTLERSKIVIVPRNLGTQNNLALSITQNISPRKWWDITFNGTLYRLNNNISFDQFRNFNLEQIAGRMNLVQTFKLPFQLIGELSAAYNSKRLTGANDISRSTSQLDIGLQRSFYDKKATLRLVLNDLYQGSRSSSEQSYSDFYLRSYGYYETRQIRLNFTYKFANINNKGPRTRNSALENENGRIK